MRKRKTCMAVCALTLAMACETGSLIPVYADTATSTAQASTGNTASIHIKLKDVKTPMDGISFDIYKLATYSPVDGTFSYDALWGIKSLPETSGEMDKLAEQLAGEIKGGRITSCKTDKEGEASLDAECGIYLLVPDNTKKYGDVSPFILRLPYLETVTGQETEWVYQAEVEPKVVPPEKETDKKPKPTASPSENPTATPSESPTATTVPESKPTETPGTPGSQTETSASLKGTDDVDTGDYTNIAFLVLCLLLAGVNIKFISKKKEK